MVPASHPDLPLLLESALTQHMPATDKKRKADQFASLFREASTEKRTTLQFKVLSRKDHEQQIRMEAIDHNAIDHKDHQF